MDGRIQARFGFGAVSDNDITHKRHHHHAYWRLEFDIGGKGNSQVYVLDPSLESPQTTKRTLIEREDMMERGPGRSWGVVDTTGKNGYKLEPGGPELPSDRSRRFVGMKDEEREEEDDADIGFAAGDIWILNSRSNRAPGEQEVSDGELTTRRSGAQLDKFISAPEDEDSKLTGRPVIWYGGHCTHDDTKDNIRRNLGEDLGPFRHGHAVGFTLFPWALSN